MGQTYVENTELENDTKDMKTLDANIREYIVNTL